MEEVKWWVEIGLRGGAPRSKKGGREEEEGGGQRGVGGGISDL